MTVLYFDCFAGVAGDMIVGALLDAGASFDALRGELAKLALDGCQFRAEQVRRSGLGGTKFQVDVAERGHHHHRYLADIIELIQQAGLSSRATSRAKAIFRRLGEAEAKVHRIPVAEVHFHEVGALDSVADIVGACIAMDLLDVEEVHCSAIPAGSGTVQCGHGLLPVPAPAAAAMLTGAKLADDPLEGEVTTPTGAAILTTLTKSYGPLPPMDIQAVGYGAGTREGGPLPNLLRVYVGKLMPDAQADSVVELSANLDDCTGEVIGATLGALMEAGCLDAWASPIYMKKNRPAVMLSALCLPGDARTAEEIFFRQTTTFGVRRRLCQRQKLLREHQTVETRYGPVRVKVGRRNGEVLTASPEFSDCQSAADAHHVSAREVMEAALCAYRMGRSQ
jgi:hypothetical protein